MVKIFKKKSVKKTNQYLELKINSINQSGQGVGRCNGKVCFIENALPNEQVKALITQEKKNFIQAKLIKINEASEHRVKPSCQHYEQCGGCQLQHLSHEQQVIDKQSMVNDLLIKGGWKKDIPWLSSITGPTWNYRQRARLATYYDRELDYLNIGFRAKNSKKIVNIDSCIVLEAPFANKLLSLRALCNQLEKKSVITHIDINTKSEFSVLNFRLLSPLSSEDQALLCEWAQENQYLIQFDFGDNKSEWLTNPESLHYTILDKTIKFDLSDFTQVNASINDKMLPLAISWLALSKQDTILDLFSGLGNFSIPIAPYVSKIVGIEGIDDMVKKADLNAQINHVDNAEFRCVDLSKATSEIFQNANKVLLDPARAGAEQVCKLLGKTTVDTVLYVSCNPNSLALDAGHLFDAGFEVKKIMLLDMFPHTSHVETMALFTRRLNS